MSQKNKQLAIFILLSVIFLFGCSLTTTIAIGPLQTDTQSLELGAAETVDAEIAMGTGSLTLQGGEVDLMDATFTYNVAEWAPEVDYDLSGSRGVLQVRQPESSFEGIPENLDETRNDWDLTLSNQVPLNLTLSLGAGENSLNLAGLQLTTLSVDTGAGSTDLVLGGSSMTSFDFDMGIGEATLDFTGDWAEDLTAVIKGGVGELALILPSDVGVQVTVSTGLGDIDATGLNKSGDTYTNDAFGEADVTLFIDISGGVGEITLRQAE